MPRPEPPQPAYDLPQHVEVVDIASLHPHPRNYREHPEDQLAHLIQSLETNGFYRNVVIARDGTILAGHGIVLAAQQLHLTHIPVVRLDVDAQEERALKILIGDNEIARRATDDDRALTELLKSLNTGAPDALLGTGYDAAMLGALVYVTRPASEIQDANEAAHWVGMPTYEDTVVPVKLILSFRTVEDRAACLALLGSPQPSSVTNQSLTAWWPPKQREDKASVRFVEGTP